MDRACLEYGVRAGLIFCLAREFSLELNEILVKKAVKYKSRGVVGIDLAGPGIAHAGAGRTRSPATATCSRGRARRRSGTTVHTGETAYTAVPGVLAVLKELAPSRIGHGIAAATSEEALREAGRIGHGAGDLSRARTCARTRWRTSQELGFGAARVRDAPASATRSTPTARTC